jgi:nucleoside-diphosphate-sugar epimerase
LITGQVVVFGGTGFLGGWLTAALAGRGTPVVCTGTSASEPTSPGITAVRADITRLQDVCDVLAEYRPSVVANAAYVLPSGTDLHRSLEVNLMGTANVFEACRLLGIRRCVYSSSIAVYGSTHDPSGPALTESAPAHADTPYGQQKLLNETTARQYRRKYGLDAIGLRLATLYGPGRAAGGTACLSRMVGQMRAGRVGECDLRSDFPLDLLHVADAAASLADIVLGPAPQHDIYNLTGEAATPLDILTAVRSEFPAADAVFGDVPQSNPPAIRYDSARLRSEFGRSPQSLHASVRGWDADPAPR